MKEKFYVRKMGHQELGYTKGIGGGQRGRYILVSKRLSNFFPEFEEDSLEPSISINVVSPDNKKLITCEYVWHNNSKHIGQDKRIYLNLDVEDSKKDIMPEDFVVFYKIEDDDENKSSFIYKLYKYDKYNSEYEKLLRLTDNKTHTLHNNINFIDTSNLSYGQYELSKRTREKYRNLINKKDDACSKNEFKNLLRSAYNFKCGISEKSFTIPGSYTNLQAAHIMPDSHGGPYRPDNGILLSLDFHWAFDHGCFTFNDDLSILVHEKMKNTSLYEFNNYKIQFPDNEIFIPNKDFVEYHKQNIYGRFRPLRKNEALTLN